MNVQEVTETVVCKVAGCVNETAVTRGPYAMLCEKHAKEAKYGKRHASKNANGSYVGNAKALIAAGKRLDTATARFETAHAELEQAKNAWNQAVDQLGLAEIPKAGG